MIQVPAAFRAVLYERNPPVMGLHVLLSETSITIQQKAYIGELEEN